MDPVDAVDLVDSAQGRTTPPCPLRPLGPLCLLRPLHHAAPLDPRRPRGYAARMKAAKPQPKRPRAGGPRHAPDEITEAMNRAVDKIGADPAEAHSVAAAARLTLQRVEWEERSFRGLRP